MADEAWNSSPSFLSENRGKSTAAGCFLLGLIILLLSVYVLATETYFFSNADAFDAKVVEVRHEYVAAGTGSVLAYVPVVELQNAQDRVTVDTYSKENVYSVGTKMSVLCDLSASKRCVRNTFLDVWWGAVDLSLSLMLLVPSLLYLRRARQGSNHQR